MTYPAFCLRLTASVSRPPHPLIHSEDEEAVFFLILWIVLFSSSRRSPPKPWSDTAPPLEEGMVVRQPGEGDSSQSGSEVLGTHADTPQP